MTSKKNESSPLHNTEREQSSIDRGLKSVIYIPSFDRKLVFEILLRSLFDLTIFLVLLAYSLLPNAAQIISFAGSTILIFGGHFRKKTNWGVQREGLYFLFTSIMAFFIRSGVFSIALNKWSLDSHAAIIPALLIYSIILYVGDQLNTRVGSDSPESHRQHFDKIITSLVAYLLLLRLVYIGIIELIPEEAYYWDYAQHLDWGYLDHPPMVAWTIKFGTIVFGNSEFGVRIGAVMSWIAAAVFIYGITKDWFGRRAAVMSLLLSALLPFYFGIGAILTPDAPLTAFWAGLLFFIQRALLQNKKYGWWMAGIFLGFGLLSKYTIALMIPAVLIYLILEPGSRRWLKRPEPYLAIFIAAILFSPVIYWNSKHEWVSFLFQTTRRIGETIHFSPHLLLGSILFLITPFGLWSAEQALFQRNVFFNQNNSAKQIRLFMMIMTLFPLAIFLIFSLTHEPKLNWTGPLWLATIPGISLLLSRLRETRSNRSSKIVYGGWITTIVLFALLYGAALNYLSPGYPVVRYSPGMRDIAGWSDLGRQIGEAVRSFEQDGGAKLLVVGMDKYNIASELAFYNPESGPEETSSAHLFGQNGLMYKYWFPPENEKGKNILMVARDARGIGDAQVGKYFNRLDSILEIDVTLNGNKVTSYCSRIGFGYNPTVLK